MLSVCAGNSLCQQSGDHQVYKVPCRTPLKVLTRQTDHDVQTTQVHITSVVGTEEQACRFLDATARAAFPQLPLLPGSIDVVQSPAGSGKTTLNIKLARNLLESGQINQAMIVAFNRQAVLDGKARTKDEPRIHWKTLDSLVFELYKEEQKDRSSTDLDDINSIATMATGVLGMPVYPEEAEEMMERLKRACSSGYTGKLFRETKTIFAAGMRGCWWSYDLLRLRARTHPGWINLFKDYPIVFVDESQDISKPMFDLLSQLHSTKHMVYSGDKCQKLYSFMGCIDLLNYLNPTRYRLWRFYLTFRHGPKICEYVNERTLPAFHTFAATGTYDTDISFVNDDQIINGAHVYILSSWRNILDAADRHLNAGRLVRMDKDKRDELLLASKAECWTKYDKGLFKHMNKEFVYDIVSRMQSDFVEPDEVIMSTVHGYKGLEYNTVRVSRCVMDAKPRAGEVNDIPFRVYVAVTRVREHLWLPGKRKS